MSHAATNRCLICFRSMPRARAGRRRKTCSDGCRQKLHRRASRRGPDYRLAKRKLARLERQFGPYDDTHSLAGPSMRWRVLFRLDRGIPIPHTCRCCGRPFVPRPNNGLGPHLCSRPCKNQMRKRRHAIYRAIYVYRHGMRISDAAYDRIRRDQPLLFCAHCGIPFVKQREHGKPPKYCSLKCRQAAYYRRSHPPILRRDNCPSCGRRFPVRSPLQKHCSKRCQRRASRQRRVHHLVLHPVL